MNQKEYKEYKDAFRPLFSEELDQKRLLSILNEKLRPIVGSIPKRLYRYRTFSEYSMREILLQNVFLAKPSSFDDRFDSQYISFEQPEIPRLKSEEEIAKEKVISFLDDLIVKDRNAFFHNVLRISCFTTDCCNVPMWYYYANQHKGMCIEYDLSDLPAFDEAGYCFLPVIYPNRNEEILFRKLGKRLNSDAVCNALIKNKDWEFEKEWRMIRISDKTEKEYASVKIKKVIMGCDASLESTVLLADMIKKNDLDIKMSRMLITPKGMKEQMLKL